MCKERLGECVSHGGAVRPAAREPTRPAFRRRHYMSARHLETAAACAKDSGTASGEEVGALYRRAAALYSQASRPQAAAEALARGGKAVDGLDSSLSVELFLEACALFEEEGKDVYAMDTYRAAEAAMIKTEKLGEAVTVFLRHAGACDRVGSHASLARCYLSAVIVYLTMCDPVGAEHGYHDFMEVDSFEKSEEARAAWELLDAYQQGDVAALKKVTARGVFTGLEQCVIKLAKKLPVGDFAGQAAKLNAARGGGPSADAAALESEDLT